jgi:hypothetical protein
MSLKIKYPGGGIAAAAIFEKWKFEGPAIDYASTMPSLVFSHIVETRILLPTRKLGISPDLIALYVLFFPVLRIC